VFPVRAAPLTAAEATQGWALVPAAAGAHPAATLAPRALPVREEAAANRAAPLPAVSPDHQPANPNRPASTTSKPAISRETR
jgi:hypothetical protein